MADAVATFDLNLGGSLQANAAKGRASLTELSTAFKNAKTQLAGYQSQLALSKELGDVAGFNKYSALVKGAQQNVFNLGQKAEGASAGIAHAEASAAAMGKVLGGVAIGAGIAAAAIGGLASVTESLVVKSLEVVNANQLMAAQFEAMGKGPGAGGKTLDMLNGLSEKLPQSREQLAQWTRQIEKMGVTDLGKIRSELIATASAQAVLGEGGAEAYEKISRKVNNAIEAHGKLKITSKELTRTIGVGLASDVAGRLGMSLEKLETGLKAGTIDAQKFGDALNTSLTSKGRGPLDVMMNSLSTMGHKASEALSHLFDGIDTKPLTDAFRSVIALGDQGAPSGQTLKAGLTAGLNGIISALGHGITAAEIFFLKVEILGLQAYIGLKPLLGALGKISDLMGRVGGALGSAKDAAVGGVSSATGVSKGEIQNQGADAGKMVLAGLDIGLTGGVGVILNMITGLGDSKAQELAHAQGVAIGKAAIEGVKEGTQTHSPSIAAMKIGLGIGEGLGQGMEASPAPARAARTISGNALGGIGGAAGIAAANDTGSKGPTSNVFHINITAPDGVTDATQLSVVGLATALERYQIGSGR